MHLASYQRILLFFINVCFRSSADESMSNLMMSPLNFFWLYLQVIWSATRLWLSSDLQVSIWVIPVLWSSGVYLTQTIWYHSDHQLPTIQASWILSLISVSLIFQDWAIFFWYFEISFKHIICCSWLYWLVLTISKLEVYPLMSQSDPSTLIPDWTSSVRGLLSSRLV